MSSTVNVCFVLVFNTMLEPEALRRQFGDAYPESLDMTTHKTLFLDPFLIQWTLIWRMPDAVRCGLEAAPKSLHIGDDMSRSFATLAREALAMAAFALRRFEPRDQTFPFFRAGRIWDDLRESMNLFPTAPGAGHELSCLLWRYRPLSTLPHPEGGNLRSSTYFVLALDTVSESLTRYGVKPHQQRLLPCCYDCAHRSLILTPRQVDGLRCAYSYVTLLLMAAVVRSDNAVDECASRLGRLWRRVSHLLQTGRDDPTLADPPPRYSA